MLVKDAIKQLEKCNPEAVLQIRTFPNGYDDDSIWWDCEKFYQVPNAENDLVLIEAGEVTLL